MPDQEAATTATAAAATAAATAAAAAALATRAGTACLAPPRRVRPAVLAVAVTGLLAATLRVDGEPAGDPAGPPVLFAAASLTSVLEELVGTGAVAAGAPAGTETPPAGRPPRARLSLAGSSTLARQIEMGAPADLFIAASNEWMDYLAQRGLLEPDTRGPLLGNQLVLIAPRGQPVAVRMDSAFDLGAAFAGRLALGDPDHVPAGIYARQALQSLGWWRRVEGRLAPAPDARIALMYVARGECALGVAYATDAAASDQVAVVGRFAPSTHQPIVYPAAVVRGRARPGVLALLAYLRSPQASAVFARHGFAVLQGPAPAVPEPPLLPRQRG